MPGSRHASRLVFWSCVGALAALAACSAFSGSDTAPSAAPDSGVPAEGQAPSGDGGVADAGKRCSPSDPFGTPILVSGAPFVSGAFRLTANETHAYFDNDAGKFFRAEMNGFDSVGVAIEMTVATAQIGTPSSASLSADETTIFFEDGFRLFRGTGSPGGPYTHVTHIADKSGQPFYDEDRNLLYSSFYTGGGFDRQLQRAAYANDAAAAFSLLALDSRSNYSALATKSGLYYAVDIGNGNADIYFKPLSGAELAVAGVNSQNNDEPVWISADECHLYLVSSRDGPKQVYIAIRGAL